MLYHRIMRRLRSIYSRSRVEFCCSVHSACIPRNPRPRVAQSPLTDPMLLVLRSNSPYGSLADAGLITKLNLVLMLAWDE